VQHQHRLGLPLLLVKQLLELAQELGQVGPEAVAPAADAGVRGGQEAHEDVRAAHALPPGLAGHPQGLLQRLDRRVLQQFQAQLPPRQKDRVHRTIRGRHGSIPELSHRR
jgi:hypothetical protein